MKKNIFSRQDAKNAKVFLGELSALARISIGSKLKSRDVGHSTIAKYTDQKLNIILETSTHDR
jgi:hypothetical protein